MKNQLIYPFLFAILFAVAGCQSNDPGLNKLKVEIVAQSTQSRMSAGGRVAAPGDEVIFNSFMMGVTELSLKGVKKESGDCKDDDNEGEDESGEQTEANEDNNQKGDDNQGANWKVEGEFVVDLVAGTSTPDISGSLPAEPGIYNKMKIKLGPILPEGNSLFVEATVKQGEESYEVEFATTKEFQIYIKRKKGIEIDPSLDKVLVALSVDKLFAQIDWSKAHVDDDGVIRLQDPANAALAYKVKYNFYSLMRWGHDKNHDHHLDDHDDD